MRESRVRYPILSCLLSGSLFLIAARPVWAQQEDHRSKVPVVGKITGGSNRQAFTGKVRSLDLKRNLLVVNTVEGDSTEFFPLKKGIPVSSAGGGRIRIKALTPGTTIIVYFDVREDRRTVTEITVLDTASGGKGVKANPPS
jgi:hypothetical protein